MSIDSGWTKTHGYFLQMGGFILQHEDGTEEVLTDDTLSILIARKQVILPLVPEAELQDRSKADALSKAVIIGQTTWFITQCIARKVQYLAITELELITIALAILNGFMYFLWWNKPMDVQVPIVVQKNVAAPAIEYRVRNGDEGHEISRSIELGLLAEFGKIISI